MEEQLQAVVCKHLPTVRRTVYAKKT
jgi:hypothetical protein